ncbi:unnamed protein product [Moneuplotes crassus]|uniref:Uncharacterized protein n=1 Tax=Euplotes crassus TaxID=5936 RepID=A0AAD1XTF8_EUPCR|nr:unnamed protein product [Moneuplotes crassus]
MEGERTWTLALLISTQVIYLAFMVLVRPFSLVFDNCLKITCESFLFFIMVYMIGMESESDWPEGAIKGFMAILIINAAAIMGIVICFTVLHIIGLFSQSTMGSGKDERPEYETDRKINTPSRVEAAHPEVVVDINQEDKSF